MIKSLDQKNRKRGDKDRKKGHSVPEEKEKRVKEQGRFQERNEVRKRSGMTMHSFFFLPSLEKTVFTPTMTPDYDVDEGAL